MRLLMIAFRDITDECSGITRKVLSQYKEFGGKFDTYLIGRNKNNIVILHKDEKKVISCHRLNRYFKMLKVAKAIVKNKEIDFLYFRRVDVEPATLSALKSFKKSGVKKILWEIPTYPYDDETTSFSRKIKKMIDKVFRGNLKKYVSRIVTFSNEKNIFGIETINTGNGIDIDEIRKRKVSDHGDEINLVAAAVVRDWHGYDRLIEGLSNYKGDRKISFHLAGDGPSLLIYKELVKKYNLEDKVHFYGLVNKDKLDEIYDIADIAVESLGWHRSKVKFGTSIKTREYLAKGLPIIASSVMDMFPDGFEYAYYAKIDDSPINIDEVIKFYDEIYKENTKEELNEKIRKIAYEKCSMEAMLKPVIDFYTDEDV